MMIFKTGKPNGEALLNNEVAAKGALIEEAEVFTFTESNCEYVLFDDYRALVEKLKAADEVVEKVSHLVFMRKNMPKPRDFSGLYESIEKSLAKYNGE